MEIYGVIGIVDLGITPSRGSLSYLAVITETELVATFSADREESIDLELSPPKPKSDRG